MNHKHSFWILLVFILISCQKENHNTVVDIKEDLKYYPLNVGSYVDYEIEYIFWDDFAETVDTTNYILREFVESKVTNFSGDTLYRIEQFTKNHPDSVWSIPHIVFAGIRENYVYKVEDNINYVKIILPVRENTKWDGNAYNSLPNQVYQYLSVGKPFSFSPTNFEKVAHVLQEDNQTLINQDFEEEMYAFNIGLIFKRQIHLKKTYNPISQSFEISSGYSFTQIITNYGTL